MADNVTVNSAASFEVATRSVTYSGDASRHVQVLAPVLLSGADDAKTATDISDTAPLPVKAGTLAAVTGTWNNASGSPVRASIAVDGFSVVVVRLIGSSMVGGTIQFERSDDGGTTWHYATALLDANGAPAGNMVGSLVGADIGSNTLELRINAAGFTHVAVKVFSTITSGSVAYRITGSAAPAVTPVVVYADPFGTGRLPTRANLELAGTALTQVVAGLDSSGSGVPTAAIVAQVDDTLPASVTENQFGPVRMSSRRALLVEGVSGGTAVKTDGSAVTQPVSGDVAHDGIDSGNPVKVGMRAIAHGTNPTAVAAADRTDWLANRAGIPFVIGGHPNVISLELAVTAAQTDVAIVTVSSGTKIVVTQLMIVTDNANTAFPQCRVGFGATNTPTTTGVIGTHPALPAGGGFTRGDGSGILGVGGDGEDLRITCGAPTGGSLRVLVSYYTIES